MRFVFILFILASLCFTYSTAEAVSQQEKIKQQNTSKNTVKKVSKKQIKKRVSQKKITTKPFPKKIIAKKIPSKTVFQPMSIGGFSFKTEVADTRQEHEKGLSGRKSLGIDETMLFVFPKEGVYSFWMKDMLFSVDIIWIGKDLVIKGYAPHVKPDSYPSLYQPGHAILYALEAPDGFVEKHSIAVGEKVKLPSIVTRNK